MNYVKKKKTALIMINGWRADPINAGRLKMLELSAIEESGDEFVKAKLMDDIFKRGLDSLEADNDK